MALISFVLKYNGKGCPPCPPYNCGAGEKLIFFTDPSLLANGTGVILLDIVSRVYNSNTCKFEYTVSYDNSALSDPNRVLSQSDQLNVCCYNCAAEYSDLNNVFPDCDQVNLCVTPFNVEDGVPNTETVGPGETLTVLGGNSIDTTVGPVKTVTVELLLSNDSGQLLKLGTDNNVFLECDDIIPCLDPINVVGDTGNDIIFLGEILQVFGTGLVTTSVTEPVPGTTRIEVDVDGSALGFDLVGDSGTTENVAPGDLMMVLGGTNVSTVGSAPDTITINVPDGANGSFTVDADAGTPQTTESGDTVNFLGTGEINTIITTPGAGIADVTINMNDISSVVSELASEVAGPIGDITDLGDNVTFNSIALVLPNLNAFRSISYLVCVGTQVSVEIGEDGIWEHHLELDIDGGGFNTVAQGNYGPNTDAGTIALADVWNLIFYIIVIVPASGSTTLTFRNRIECTATATSTSTINEAELRTGRLGVAIN